MGTLADWARFARHGARQRLPSSSACAVRRRRHRAFFADGLPARDDRHSVAAGADHPTLRAFAAPARKPLDIGDGSVGVPAISPAAPLAVFVMLIPHHRRPAGERTECRGPAPFHDAWLLPTAAPRTCEGVIPFGRFLVEFFPGRGIPAVPNFRGTSTPRRGQIERP